MAQKRTLSRKLSVVQHYCAVKLSQTLGRNLCGPFHVYVEVTKKCNLRCQFCDIWRAKEDTIGEMTLENLLRLAEDLKELGTKAVGLYGGEALLRPDLFEVITAMKRAGLHVTLDTNGYLLPQFHEQILDSGVD